MDAEKELEASWERGSGKSRIWSTSSGKQSSSNHMRQVVVSLLVDKQRKYSSDDKSQGPGKVQAIRAQ